MKDETMMVIIENLKSHKILQNTGHTMSVKTIVKISVVITYDKIELEITYPGKERPSAIEIFLESLTFLPFLSLSKSHLKSFIKTIKEIITNIVEIATEHINPT